MLSLDNWQEFSGLEGFGKDLSPLKLNGTKEHTLLHDINAITAIALTCQRHVLCFMFMFMFVYFGHSIGINDVYC